jgi:hypothetical protein
MFYLPKPHSLEFAQPFAAERGGQCLHDEARAKYLARKKTP